MNGNGPLIPLAGLYESVSKKSDRRYYSGFLGRAKLVLLEVPEDQREEGRQANVDVVCDAAAGEAR